MSPTKNTTNITRILKIKGFSLVELVVVVSIISILSLVGYISYSDNVVVSRDSARSNDLEKIHIDLKSHKQKEGSYPLPTSPFTITNSGNVITQGLMSSGIISNVIQDVPRDPKTKNFYTYSVNSNRQQYQVALTKENQETPIAVVSGDYKSVAKDLFPTMIIAYSGTNSIDMSGSLSNTNRNKFIVNGGTLNLPYDLNGSVVQSATSFTNVTTESGVTIETGGNFFSCSEIYEAGRSLGPGVYQIVNDSGVLIDTTCTMDTSIGAPIVYTCAANPTLTHTGTLTTGTPTSPSQAWVYDATALTPCSYTCVDGYSGNDCATPPVPSSSCAASPSFTNIGTLTTGTPSSVNQAWVYNASGSTSCSYNCINDYSGDSCATPPPSCATNPTGIPNLGSLTIGTPTVANQAWTYSAGGGNCTYACLNNYSGTNCATPPPNSCAADPVFANVGALTIGTPSSVGQAWTYSATGGNCTYSCINGYYGSSCATAPVAYASGSSTAFYTPGMGFTYSGVTVTVTSAGVGTSSSKYTGCDTSDIVIWASTYNPQIWAACNAGATTSVGYDTVPAQSPNPTSNSTLPPNRVTSVQGGYYQWGRNDNVLSGTFAGGNVRYGGILSSPSNTTGNNTYYGGDPTYGDWYWTGATNPVGGWNISNGGNNQGPCATGYHVPTGGASLAFEWPKAGQLIAGTMNPFTSTGSALVRNTLKLPYAGRRELGSSQYANQGTYGQYWTSNHTSQTSYYITVGPSSASLAGASTNRSFGFSVRCIKN